MGTERLDLVYRVLDLQVIDVNDRRCGKVDDIELEGEPLRAAALLIGMGTYPRRLPGKLLSRIARRFVGPEVLGGNLVRVPWEDIESITSTVTLKRPAKELGLGRGDDELSPVVGRILFAPRDEK